MYKIEYTHIDLNASPAAVTSALEYRVNPNSCFSCMAFETFDAAMSVVSNAADQIAKYIVKRQKEIRLCKTDRILPVRSAAGKDGRSVVLQYNINGCWERGATWSIYESKGGFGRAMIVFLDKDGFRCTYEFDTLADMFNCIKKDKYLASNKKILLVADEGIPIYSSLLFQPGMNPGKERNQAHIRVVFRGEDGVRRTLECDSVEDFFHCVRATKQLNEKAEILLVATNGALAYSSLAPQGELKKKAGLKEILDWFSDAYTKEG